MLEVAFDGAHGGLRGGFFPLVLAEEVDGEVQLEREGLDVVDEGGLADFLERVWIVGRQVEPDGLAGKS